MWVIVQSISFYVIFYRYSTWNHIWYSAVRSSVGWGHCTTISQGTWLPDPRRRKGRLSSLSDNDSAATQTSLKKWIRAASNFIALIPSHSIRQMWVIFSGVEFVERLNAKQWLSMDNEKQFISGIFWDLGSWLMKVLRTRLFFDNYFNMETLLV